MQKMVELSFNWILQRGHTVDQKSNRYLSKKEINSEWSLQCLWTLYDNYYTPEILKISRKNAKKDVVVSGTFKLMRDQNGLLDQRFIQLIAAGITTTHIVLDLPIDDGYYNRGYYNQTPSYSVSGTLTIPADLSINEFTKGVNLKSVLELSKNFKCLLDPKATVFSDLKLNCGTASFSVHKSILSVRSPVFAAMFTTEMKENLENKVDISDISPDVLKNMLMYIYTGNTGVLSVQSAGELLFAGDKYQIQDLKRVCCAYLKHCASIQNIFNCVILGDLHDKNLKVFALNFICDVCEEFKVIEETLEWKNLVKTMPSLAMEVLTCLVKSKDEKLKNRK